MDNSALRGITVEEVPSVVPETAPETVPVIPHAEDVAPPVNSRYDAIPPIAPVVPITNPGPPPSMVPPVSTSNLPPNGHSVMGKTHTYRKFLFLIPAVALIATIYFVAKLSGNSYGVRAPEAVVIPQNVIEEEIQPTPIPRPKQTKKYINEDLLIELSVPEDYILDTESSESASFSLKGNIVFMVRNNELTNYDAEDNPQDVLVGGREGVRVSLPDEGSVPVVIVQTKDKPIYEFVAYLDENVSEDELGKILESVVFLVDSSDWKTYDNTTYGYKINYPPDWAESTAIIGKDGLSPKTDIGRNPADRSLNNLVIQTSTNQANAALTASDIISSTRTLSGWSSPPKIELRKLGGGDAQIIQGELSGKWRAYVVIWYKNSVIQMTWDDTPGKPYQKYFEKMLETFEFTI